MSNAIIIDPEFKALIPPLTSDERAQLRENIRRDGVIIEDLAVWKGHKILLDGHNREEISREFGIGYNIRQIELADRAAAIEWIVTHQLGRRNLPLSVRIELVSHLKPGLEAAAAEREKATQASPGEKVGAKGGMNSSPPTETAKTREILAKAAGVSPQTIDKFDKVKTKGTPALQKAASDNRISLNAAADAADLPPDKQDEIAKSTTKKDAAKAVKLATTPSESDEDQNDTSPDPREVYNAGLIAEAEAIESVARRLNKLVDFDKGHNPGNPFAKGHLHHAATVGALRQIKRTLEECQVVSQRGDRYIIKREADHTARVTSAKRGAA